MMMIFIMTSLMISFIFIFLFHPLSLGLGLLLQTIIISLITGLLSFNYWYSYILFLIMIGGMLVLFIYMTSVASNEKFKFSKKLFLLSLSFIFFTSPGFIFDSYYINKMTKNYDLMCQNEEIDFILSLSKFINWPFNMIFFMMIIYLLITLIMVVKITTIEYGPLRQKL
nr:NADH dehydrogenase subunit 6 [Agapanthia amurensis]